MKLSKDPPPSKWNKKTNSSIGEQSTANTNLSSCSPKTFAIFLLGKNATTLNKDAYKSPKPSIQISYIIQGNLLKKPFRSIWLSKSQPLILPGISKKSSITIIYTMAFSNTIKINLWPGWGNSIIKIWRKAKNMFSVSFTNQSIMPMSFCCLFNSKACLLTKILTLLIWKMAFWTFLTKRIQLKPVIWTEKTLKYVLCFLTQFRRLQS